MGLYAENMPTKTIDETRTHSRTSGHYSGTQKHSSFPAPPELATPTDLKPEDVAAIVTAVNTLVADSFALYTKTKNFHWHLAGSHFRDYHLLFDEHAAEIFESIDVLAERVRRIGGTTIRAISHISELQTIKDDLDDFVPAKEMVERLLADNRHMAEAQRKALEICDSAQDHGTTNELEDILNHTEKRIWFLYEITQGRG